MSVPLEHERKKPHPSWWILLPVEQAAAFGLMCLAAPAAWATYLLSQRHVLFGSFILLAWLAVTAGFGIWAHRRQYVRLWITGVLVATVLIACVVFLVADART
jgi:hypothetical protein